VGLTVALLLAEILNVVQVFSPRQPKLLLLLLLLLLFTVVSKQKMQKTPGKTRKYLGFSPHVAQLVKRRHVLDGPFPFEVELAGP